MQRRTILLIFSLLLIGLLFAPRSSAYADDLRWSTMDLGIYTGYSWNRYHPETFNIIENPRRYPNSAKAVAQVQRRAEAKGGVQYRSMSARPMGVEARFQVGGRYNRLTAVLDTEMLFLNQTYADITLGIGWQATLNRASAFVVEVGMDVLGMVGFLTCVGVLLDDDSGNDECSWYESGNRNYPQAESDTGYLTRFMVQATYRHAVVGSVSVFTRLRHTFRTPEVNAWFTHPFRSSSAIYVGSSVHW